MMYTIPFVSTIPQLNGIGVVDGIGEKLKSLNSTKVMILCDKGVLGTGIPDKIAGIIKDAGLEVVINDSVQTDPPDTVCNAAAEFVKANGIDGLVAIGGGSSMDTGKAVKILATNPGTINDYLDDYTWGARANPMIPLIVIPTTAGTGAEASRGGVITDTTRDKKCAIVVNADFAYVDPTLTLGLPRRITASTAFDALAHLLDAMANKKTDRTTQAICQEGIKLFLENIHTVVNEPSNIQARATMATAANLGGLALVSCSCSLPHAFGHSFGAMFHNLHGECVTYFEPVYIETVADLMPEEAMRIVEALNVKTYPGEDVKTCAIRAANKVVALAKSVDMPPIQDVCPTAEECYGIIPNALIDTQGYNSVYPITEESAKFIIDRTYEYWTK